MSSNFKGVVQGAALALVAVIVAQSPARGSIFTSPCMRTCPMQAAMQRVSIGEPPVSGSLPSMRG